MCFKKPKAPKAPAPDPVLEMQKEDTKRELQAEREEQKKNRLEEVLKAGTKPGRTSLFTGAAGGAGYKLPAPRSLFATVGG